MEPNSYYPRDYLEALIKLYEPATYAELLAILLEEKEPSLIQNEISSYIKNHKRMKPKDKPSFLETIKNSGFFKPEFLKIKYLINLTKAMGILYLKENQFLELFSILEKQDAYGLSSFLQKNINAKDHKNFEEKLHISTPNEGVVKKEIDNIFSKFGVNYMDDDQVEELQSLITLKKSNDDLTKFFQNNFYEDSPPELENTLQGLLDKYRGDKKNSKQPQEVRKYNQTDKINIPQYDFPMERVTPQPNSNKQNISKESNPKQENFLDTKEMEEEVLLEYSRINFMNNERNLAKDFWENFQKLFALNKPDYDENIIKILIFDMNFGIPLKELPEIVNKKEKEYIVQKINESPNLFELMGKLRPFLYDLLKRKK